MGQHSLHVGMVWEQIDVKLPWDAISGTDTASPRTHKRLHLQGQDGRGLCLHVTEGTPARANADEEFHVHPWHPVHPLAPRVPPGTCSLDPQILEGKRPPLPSVLFFLVDCPFTVENLELIRLVVKAYCLSHFSVAAIGTQ